jgi:hypothetical protein
MVLLVIFSRMLRVETHFELGFRPEGQPYLSRTSLPKLQGLLCWSIGRIAFLCLYLITSLPHSSSQDASDCPDKPVIAANPKVLIYLASNKESLA